MIACTTHSPLTCQPPGDPDYDLTRETQAASSLSMGMRRDARKRQSAPVSLYSTADGTPARGSRSPARVRRAWSLQSDDVGEDDAKDSQSTSFLSTLRSARARSASPPVSRGGGFDKNHFRSFLLRSAAEDAVVVSPPKLEQLQQQQRPDYHQSYLARLDYLPVAARASETGDVDGVGAEHRRMSASSSASGYTDRRSSTSSNGAATLTSMASSGSYSSRYASSSAASASSEFAYVSTQPATGGEVGVRKPWTFISEQVETVGETQPEAKKLDGDGDVGSDSDSSSDCGDDEEFRRLPEYNEGDDADSAAEDEGPVVEPINVVSRSPRQSAQHRAHQSPISPELQRLRLRDDAAGASALKMAGSLSPLPGARKSALGPAVPVSPV